MKRRIVRSVVAIAASFGLLIPPPAAQACGPYFTEAIFIQTKHPDLPFEKYAGGELGIVRPSYARSYLVVAYRFFAGKGLSASEQRQAVALWNFRLTNSWSDLGTNGKRKPKDAAQLWLEARKEAGAEETPESKKLREGGNALFGDDFDRYLAFSNCTENALATATATLKERVQKFSAKSDAVKEWVEAQDVVFSNCKADRDGRATGLRLPEQAGPNLAAVLRADREYQMAASYFYGMKWYEAEKRFLKIAENNESPWRQTAAVVAVRCRIREATLDKGGKLEDLQAADARLRTLEAEPGMKEMKPAIRKLRGFVEFRTNPEGRRLELAEILATGSSPATLREDLDDYTRLLDGALGEDLEGDPPPPSEAATRRSALTRPEQHDDLTDWIINFQAAGEEAAAHAYARWKATKAMPWLVAALSKEQPNPTRREELLAAAGEVAEQAPAYATTSFYRAKLLTHEGNKDEARKILDKLLQGKPGELPVSSRNFALALRMKLARNFDEFLKFAPRETAALGLNIEGYDLPDPPEGCQYGSAAEKAKCRERLKPVSRFDSDAARVFTEKLPTKYWLQAAESSILPQRQRKELAAAAWVRSVLLGADADGKRAAATLAKLAPELKEGLQKYEDASGADEKRFAAMLLLLSRPEMVPEVRGGSERETEPGKVDSYGNNWWCTQAGGVSADDDYMERYYSFYNKWTAPLTEIYGKENGRPDFVTNEEWSAAQNEVKKLAGLGPGPNWLSAQAMAFAQAHPEDPRAPEALHRAVLATRHGCGDEATGKYSKQAFQLLHHKYPKSEWTKKTPYWFN